MPDAVPHKFKCECGQVLLIKEEQKKGSVVLTFE